jgi:hypothetical protein
MRVKRGRKQPGIVSLQKLGSARDRIPACAVAESGPTLAYDTVPKDFRENLRWRKDIIRQASNDKAFAEYLWRTSRKDPWFWLNGFCWTYDPRLPLNKIPFITFEFQDYLLHELFKSLGRYDILIEKSRDMGVSWICLAMYAHQVQFEEFQMFMMVSRKADYVYKKDDPDCLFWKLEYLLKTQPEFMDATYNIVEMNLTKPERNNTVKGESATGDMGRGGRNRSIFKDEFAAFSKDDGFRALAATADNTNNRIFNSTPQGTGDAFYEVRQNPNTTRVTLHWSEDPRKNAGMYTTGKTARDVLPKQFAPTVKLVSDEQLFLMPCTPRGKEMDIVQPEHGYKYILDGKLRSPWYDAECLRRAHPILIAQELDIDYASASFRFFDEKTIERKILTESCNPMRRGYWRFPVEGEGFEWIDDDNGPFDLWIELGQAGEPPILEDYVIGLDISLGTGASNSTMSIVNVRTGTKVASYANPNISPEEFGRFAPKIGELWNNAFMIWEGQGPGLNFSKKVLEAGYFAYFHHKDEPGSAAKSVDKPGWFSNDERKYALLSDYRDAQFQGEFYNPDLISLKECREYVNLPGNKVIHSAEQSSIDPTGARSGHGDRVIADALAWKAVCHLRGPRKARESDIPLPRKLQSLSPFSAARRISKALSNDQESESVKDW